nr:MAG: hypothetical protein [Microvirus sp.]
MLQIPNLVLKSLKKVLLKHLTKSWFRLAASIFANTIAKRSAILKKFLLLEVRTMKRRRAYRRFGYAAPHNLNRVSGYRGGIRL